MATRGYIEALDGVFLVGWAWDPDWPRLRVELDVHLTDRPPARCIADEPREDLVRAGVGDGGHGFKFRLTEPLPPGTHRVRVRGCHDGTALALHHEFRLVTETNDGAVALRAADGEERDVPPLVIAGVGGWLFRFAGLDSVERVLGRRPAAPDTVDQQIRMLKARRTQLAEWGIDYLVATMPDKSAVYREHLPADSEPVAAGRPAARLRAALRSEQHLDALDLLPVLRDARRHGRVFTRSGAELTWTGAFHAYRALAKELAKRHPDLEPLPPGWLELGDLVPISQPLDGLERIGPSRLGAAIAEHETAVEPELATGKLTATHVTLSAELGPAIWAQAIALEQPDAPLSRVVLIHEGAAARPARLLAEHCGQATIVTSSELPVALIDALRPALVVQILDEGASFLA